MEMRKGEGKGKKKRKGKRVKDIKTFIMNYEQDEEKKGWSFEGKVQTQLS